MRAHGSAQPTETGALPDKPAEVFSPPERACRLRTESSLPFEADRGGWAGGWYLRSALLLAVGLVAPVRFFARARRGSPTRTPTAPYGACHVGRRIVRRLEALAALVPQASIVHEMAILESGLTTADTGATLRS